MLGISIQTVFYCWLKIRICTHGIFCWHRIINRNFTVFWCENLVKFHFFTQWWWIGFGKKTEEAKDLHGVHIGPYQKSLPQRLILSAKNKNLRTYLTIIKYICFECRRPPTYTWKQACDKFHRVFSLLMTIFLPF